MNRPHLHRYQRITFKYGSWEECRVCSKSPGAFTELWREANLTIPQLIAMAIGAALFVVIFIAWMWFLAGVDGAL